MGGAVTRGARSGQSLSCGSFHGARYGNDSPRADAPGKRRAFASGITRNGYGGGQSAQSRQGSENPESPRQEGTSRFLHFGISLRTAANSGRSAGRRISVRIAGDRWRQQDGPAAQE